MDIKLGLSIFNTAWLIEPRIGLLMFDHWLESSKQGGSFNYKASSNQGENQTAYQAYSKLFDTTSNVIIAPDNTWDLQNNFKGFDGASVAVIPIEGPIMKYDSCGAMGTITIANLVKKASNTASVKTIVLLGDSPGGSVSGTESLANTIKNSGKETICLIDGYACSAMYWIASSCKYVYAASRTSIIGSVGTMVGFYDNTEAMKQRGYVLREYYASASSDKNKSWNEALKGNGKLIIEETLDPLNNEFLQAVKNNRPALIDKEEETLKGKTYTAVKAQELGFIDGIKSLEEILTEHGSKKSNQNKSNTTMKVFQLALIAANVEAFSLSTAEGAEGFVLSEAQLNSIDATLSENATELASAKAQIKALQAQVASSANATALEAAQSQITELTEKLATAEGSLATVTAELEAEKKKPGAGFSTTDSDSDATEAAKKLAKINQKFEAAVKEHQ